MSKKVPTGIRLPDGCFCEKRCRPLSQIISSNQVSYITVCERLTNDGTERDVQDKYVVTFHNDLIHDVQYYDLRDMIDTVSVLAQAISIAENLRTDL